MGRPLFSESSTATDRSGSDLLVDAATQGKGPRRWCQKDAYPDEESWWVGREVFVEAFLDPAAEGANLAAGANVGDRLSGQSSKPNQVSDSPSNELTSDQKATDLELSEMQAQASTVTRFTISEEELANVKLDSIVEDSEDDFELAWDSSDEEASDMDFDYEPVTFESHSDASTPAPSTPVLEAHSPTLPIDIPSIPSITRHCTLPMTPNTPVKTPVRSNSVHNSVTTPGSTPIPARSIPRVRFAVHSPRTELVL